MGDEEEAMKCKPMRWENSINKSTQKMDIPRTTTWGMHQEDNHKVRQEGQSSEPHQGDSQSWNCDAIRERVGNQPKTGPSKVIIMLISHLTRKVI